MNSSYAKKNIWEIYESIIEPKTETVVNLKEYLKEFLHKNPPFNVPLDTSAIDDITRWATKLGVHSAAIAMNEFDRFIDLGNSTDWDVGVEKPNYSPQQLAIRKALTDFTVKIIHVTCVSFLLESGIPSALAKASRKHKAGVAAKSNKQKSKAFYKELIKRLLKIDKDMSCEDIKARLKEENWLEDSLKPGTFLVATDEKTAKAFSELKESTLDQAISTIRNKAAV